jgi:cytochrome c oxidase cbb3-type subunit 3
MKPLVHCSAAAALLVVWAASAQAAGDPANGEHLYKAFCVQCHGTEGNGKGVNAATMEVQPRDHTDAKEMGARTDADLFKAIKDGGIAVNKSVLMPNWDANLGDRQIDDIVAYLRVLSGTKGK